MKSNFSNKFILGIIQARMGSSRLPGKMALPIIDGKTSIELMTERLSLSKTLSKLIVATSDKPADDKIEEICKNVNLDCFRGSEEDVLDRFYKAASEYNADVVVRLTGDSPLHAPAIIDKIVSAYFESDADYASNVDMLSYPDGMEAEVFGFELLERIWKEASLPSEREHVVLRYMRNHNDMFKRINVSYHKDYSHYRLTLDEEPDYYLITKIFENLYYKNPNFTLEDIIYFLEKNPELAQVNKHIERNKGTLFSWKLGKYIRLEESN